MPWSTMLQGEDIFFHQIGIKYWGKFLGCGKLKYCNQGLTLRGPRSRRKWRRRSSSFVPSMPSTLRTRGTHNHWWDLFETRMLSMVTPLCWVTAECGAAVKVCLSQLSKVSLRVHRTKVDQKIILNLKRFIKRPDWGHRQPLTALGVRKESRLESGQSTGHSVCVWRHLAVWQCDSVAVCGDTWHLGKQRLGVGEPDWENKDSTRMLFKTRVVYKKVEWWINYLCNKKYQLLSMLTILTGISSWILIIVILFLKEFMWKGDSSQNRSFRLP